MHPRSGSPRPRDRLGRPLPRGSQDQLDPELRAVLERNRPEELLRRGASWYNQGRYFEAHECFENLWKHPRAPELWRQTWKGLAQAAAGLCHFQRGNPRGGTAVLKRAAETLRDSVLAGTWLQQFEVAAKTLGSGDPSARAPELDVAPLLKSTVAAPGTAHVEPLSPAESDKTASLRRALREEEGTCTDDG